MGRRVNMLLLNKSIKSISGGRKLCTTVPLPAGKGGVKYFYSKLYPHLTGKKPDTHVGVRMTKR